MLGTVVCAQLPVELQVIVLHQFAQDVQELVKADLVVLVLVGCPEQLCDVVGLPAALGGYKGDQHPLSIRHACPPDPSSLWTGKDPSSTVPLQEAFGKQVLQQDHHMLQNQAEEAQVLVATVGHWT